MRKLILATIGLASICLATPALAATYVFDSEGDTETLTFNGTSPGLGATLQLTLTDDDNDGNFTFSYVLTNISSPILQPQSRVSGFGFDDGSAVATSGSASGDFSFLDLTPSGPGPYADVSVCLSNSNGSCSGSGGATIGDPATGTFNLIYASNVTGLTLDDFAVRYQSTGLLGQDSGTGVEGPSCPDCTPTQTGVVPEPATWAMFIFGFAAVGYTLRRRRPYRLAQAV